MNFNRSNYLQEYVLPAMTKFNNVKEILISHGKKSTYFEYNNIKIRNFKDWDKNNEFGLTLRFLTAAEAKTDNVLIMDDDIIPTEKTVEFLIDKINYDRKNIYGIYGRYLDKDFNYSTYLCTGDCHIVLTRLLISDKSMAEYFLNNFRKYENKKIVNSKPYWNGEDILFNMMAIKRYDKLPKVYELSHTNKNILGEILNLGISGNKTHIEYRSEISKNFIREMNLESKILESSEHIIKSNMYYELVNSDILYITFGILFFIVVLKCIFMYMQ